MHRHPGQRTPWESGFWSQSPRTHRTTDPLRLGPGSLHRALDRHHRLRRSRARLLAEQLPPAPKRGAWHASCASPERAPALRRGGSFAFSFVVFEFFFSSSFSSFSFSRRSLFDSSPSGAPSKLVVVCVTVRVTPPQPLRATTRTTPTSRFCSFAASFVPSSRLVRLLCPGGAGRRSSVSSVHGRSVQEGSDMDRPLVGLVDGGATEVEVAMREACRGVVEALSKAATTEGLGAPS